MDHALIEFQRAADRENRGRRRLQRRYSPALQHQAVEYWRVRDRAGQGLRAVAAALGVAHWTLYRWVQASKASAPFRPVRVESADRGGSPSTLVIHWTAEGPRVEAVDVESAARLLMLMR